VGDGSTTFNLPDMRDRVPVGASPGSLSGNRATARTIGATGGEETHLLLSGEAAQKAITISGAVIQGGNASPQGSPFQYFETTGSLNIPASDAVAAHNVMQCFGVVNFIIKY
ncbi:MAG: hypothetical protein ACREA9_19225, partial [Pyrinomonadaceae bacterium]